MKWQPTGSCCPREGHARDHLCECSPKLLPSPPRAGGARPSAAWAQLPLPGALTPRTNSPIAVPRHRTPLVPTSFPRALPTENSTYPTNPEDKLCFKVSPSAPSICCPVPVPPASRDAEQTPFAASFLPPAAGRKENSSRISECY